MKILDLNRFGPDEFKSLFWALVVALIATCTLFFSSAVWRLIIPEAIRISGAIAYLTYDFVIALGCYVLCLKNPYSIWFVFVICNASGIVSALTEPGFWVTSMWILTILGWMISLATSLWGYDIGIRNRERTRPRL